MLRRATLPALLFAVAAASAEDFGEPVANPALERFSDRLTFLASFDHGEAPAEMAAGAHKPRAVQGDIEFRSGLFGQALAGGVVSYAPARSFPFETTGTLVFWVSPVDWAECEREGYQWWLQSGGAGSSLLIGRQGEIKGTRGATVYYHAVTAGHKPGGRHVRGGGWRDWANGSWHLIVVTWKLGRMAISVDGGRPAGGQVGRLTPQHWLNVGRKQAAGGRFLLDDVMILDRPLTADEVAWVWKESASARLAAERRFAIDAE